ncbi:MAG TPA: iron-sulfur cluster assembly accessory protein [Burkholderiales bacterium]|nr:iron-sulfur cluster assembly accessory protein [Burkholderiales bacterium]
MGARLEIREGETLLERLLEDGADIGHDCGGKLACSSCRVTLVEGEAGQASEDELDLLDRGGGDLKSDRLACQVRGPAALRVEVPAAQVPSPGTFRPVTVTPAAAAHLVRFGTASVRLRVEHSGCSGLRHRIEPAVAIGPGDLVFHGRGIAIVVGAESLPFVAGTVIEVEQAGLNRRLRFDNPNATSSCGCGESFSALDPATVGASMLDGLSSIQGATRMIELKVNDMTCGHCVGAVTKAVKALDPQAQVSVDLGAKRVSVQSAKPAGEVIHAIEEAGYPAVPA